MVLARARPCGWTGCPEERARVLGSTRHQMLPWSSLQARQAGFCLYLSTLRFSKGRECAGEREAGVQVSEELFCRELTVSLVCISLWRRDGAGTAEDQAASAALLPWEAGFSPAPSGRSAALSTADAALVPLPRQGSCRMTLNHLLKLDFSIYHWLFVTRTRSASRAPSNCNAKTDRGVPPH